MNKIPKFIKNFSKKEFSEERKEVADKIREKRSKFFNDKDTKTNEKKEIERVINDREVALEKELENINKLKNKIEEISSSKLKEILNYFNLKKIKADIILGETTYEKLKEERDSNVIKRNKINEDLNDLPKAMKDIDIMLDEFYKNQEEEWGKSEYTKEEIIENFSEDHLASLSLDEYCLLLKKYPSEMVTHVTRQGIRDHIGHSFHTIGEGLYFDGFLKMIDDGRLKSPLGVYLSKEEKDKAISEFLRLDEFKNKEEALSLVDQMTRENRNPSGSYEDRSAIHFASEEVADCYYGSEKGNEIFVAYPSAHIASQYFFSGELIGNSKLSYWNDQWVWANEERGMDIDAGVVFIPKDTKVDKENGSRYKLDENKNPIENKEYKDIVIRFVESDDFYDFAEKVIEITGGLSGEYPLMKNISNINDKQKKAIDQLEVFSDKLEKEFGIKDLRLKSVILNYHNLNNFLQKRRQKDEKEAPTSIEKSLEFHIEDALKDVGIFFEEVEDAVDSKLFWDDYFSKNPEKKPSKIVYYEGGDPTKALENWKEEKGLNKKSNDRSIGFSERNITPEEKEPSGLNRFKSLATEVVNNYFKE
ncbi:hypothetical protein EOL94_02865 [bacterium]|nr:hypothetical protein [bacterium]